MLCIKNNETKKVETKKTEKKIKDRKKTANAKMIEKNPSK